MQVSTSKSGRSSGVGEAHAVVATMRHVKRGGQVAQHLVVGFFVAQEVPLQFDVHVRRDRRGPTRRSTRPPTPWRPAAQRLAADERHQPGRLPVEIVERQRALAFRRPQLHARDQAAEVPIALAGFDEDGEAEPYSAGSGSRTTVGGRDAESLAADLAIRLTVDSNPGLRPGSTETDCCRCLSSPPLRRSP